MAGFIDDKRFLRENLNGRWCTVGCVLGGNGAFFSWRECPTFGMLFRMCIFQTACSIFPVHVCQCGCFRVKLCIPTWVFHHD